MSNQRAAILHCLFDLQDGVEEAEFRQALTAFFEHLRDVGFATSLRLMRRKPLPQFGPKLPEFSFYAAIEFPDLDREQACYDYVARDLEPVRTLHRAMNTKVQRGAQFFVTSEV